MGPSWLTIKNCQENNPKVSWCKIEVTINDFKNIKVDTNAITSPPVTVFSVALKTFLNPKTQVNEVVSLTVLANQNGKKKQKTKKERKRKKKKEREGSLLVQFFCFLQ